MFCVASKGASVELHPGGLGAVDARVSPMQLATGAVDKVSLEATFVNQRLMQRVEELSGQLAVLQYAVQANGRKPDDWVAAYDGSVCAGGEAAAGCSAARGGYTSVLAHGVKTQNDHKANRYWSAEEHERFLQGLKIHGRKNLRAIAKVVVTRTPVQVILRDLL